jgi:hypothetical protein
MFLYFSILAAAEIGLTILAAWKTRNPIQMMTATIVATLLAMSLLMLFRVEFGNTWATTLPFIFIGLCSPVVIVQLFAVNPRRE